MDAFVFEKTAEVDVSKTGDSDDPLQNNRSDGSGDEDDGEQGSTAGGPGTALGFSDTAEKKWDSLSIEVLRTYQVKKLWV